MAVEDFAREESGEATMDDVDALRRTLHQPDDPGDLAPELRAVMVDGLATVEQQAADELTGVTRRMVAAMREAGAETVGDLSDPPREGLMREHVAAYDANLRARRFAGALMLYLEPLGDGDTDDDE